VREHSRDLHAPMMRWQTWCGLSLLVLLLATALFGPIVAPHDPEQSDALRFETNADGSTLPVAPPYAPDGEFLLGSDRTGRDLLSRLLFGARYTVFFIGLATLGRVVLALVIASVAFLVSRSRHRISHLAPPRARVGAAIPEFIVVYVALFGIAFNPTMSPVRFAMIQAVLVVLVGVPNLVPTIRSAIEAASHQTFVEAQVASGADSRHILFTTILPTIFRDLLILLAHEALIVSVVLGELAVFHIFVGGTIQTNDPVEYYSRSNEWAGMVGENRAEVFGGSIRLLLIPLAFYLLVVLTFILLSSADESRRRSIRHRRR
jgi:peptide/nickel transport system permease protein